MPDAITASPRSFPVYSNTTDRHEAGQAVPEPTSAIFNSRPLLVRTFHRYRLPPITVSIFLHPTEDVYSHLPSLRRDKCTNRLLFYFLSRHCHHSVSWGSVDAINLFCCIRDDASESLSLAELNAS